MRSRLMHRVVRPVFRDAPAWTWWITAQAVGWVGGWLLAWRKPAHLSAVLQACGRADTASARRRLASRMLQRRLHALDFYLHEGTRHWQLDWEGEPPQDRRACYALLDVHGMEHVTAFMDQVDAWVVRLRFGVEGQTVAEDDSWQAHCARVRERFSRGRMVEAGSGLSTWRHVIAMQRSLVVFQGHLVDGTSATRRLLGREVPLPLGAAHLARLGGMPLRFLRLRPRGPGWQITVEAAMPADEEALRDRIERELREAPEAWILWPLLMQRPAG